MVPQKRVGIVMAGGSGERFWPLSSGDSPKQLLNLTHPDKTMLEEAVERLDIVVDEVFVSTTTKFQSIIAEKGIVNADRVLAEPSKRNTLGALVWVVAELVAKGFLNASVAVVTADHFIGDVEEFRASISSALDLCESKQSIVTFGIRPNRPETGYGYIEIDEREPIQLGEKFVGYESVAFREKPDFGTALEYLKTGKHHWNSGMFFFTIAAFQRELKEVQPEASEELEKIVESLKAGDHSGAKEHFDRLPNQSIDYAMMEKVGRLYVVPVSFPWDDVGSWDAMERVGNQVDSNSVRGNPVLIDVTGSIVVEAGEGIRVAVLGVSDLVIVSTESAVLVCHKSMAQRVRELSRKVAESV